VVPIGVRPGAVSEKAAALRNLRVNKTAALQILALNQAVKNIWDLVGISVDGSG
jgi:hypothetical protein